MSNSGRHLKDELYELLRRCTVRVYGARGAMGTGFFVAPGLIVTAAHLLEGEERPSCSVEWLDKSFEARVTAIHSKPISRSPKRDWPDLAVLEVEVAEHPCVLLGTHLSIRDPVYTFGFSDENPDGDPVTISLEGFSGERRMLKLKEGLISPGLSGAPILNERTGEVVGILEITREPKRADLGGYGTSVTTLLEYEPGIGELNSLFHLQDDRWHRLLPPAPAAPKKARLWTAVQTATLISALAAGISIVSIPKIWHRMLDTTTVILPFTSSAPGREQISEDLTQGFSEKWLRESGIRPVADDLVHPMAATLGYRDGYCIPTAVAERIRRFTGAAYIVSGSFEAYQDQQPKTLRLCLQSTWGNRQHYTHQQDLVPETLDGSLSEIARGLSRNIRVPFRSAFHLRKGRVTEAPSAARLYFEGLLHFQRYELQEALDSFNSSASEDPYFYSAHDGLARAWQELGNDGRAQDEARKALTLYGDSEKGEREWALLQASLLSTEGKWKPAIYLYRALWQSDRSDVIAAMRLVGAQNLAGSGEGALDSIQEIRSHQKTRGIQMPIEMDAKLDIEESIAHHLTGEFALQGTAATRALEKVGRDHDLFDARSWYLKCDALVSQALWPDDCQQAGATFEEEKDHINHAKFLQLKARLLHKKGDIEQALLIDREVAQMFLNVFPRGYIDQMSNLAYSLIRQVPPQVAEAEIMCDRAVDAARASQSLNLPIVLINCAYFPMLEGKLEKAKEMYESGIELSRRRSRNLWLEMTARGNLAYVQHGLGYRQEALVLYGESIALSKQLGDSGPEFGETLIRYARLLSDLGRTTEAEESYKNGLLELRSTSTEDFAVFLASLTKVLRRNPEEWQRLIKAYPFIGS